MLKVIAETAVKVVIETAANAVAEAPLGELGGLNKLVVKELDNNKVRTIIRAYILLLKRRIK